MSKLRDTYTKTTRSYQTVVVVDGVVTIPDVDGPVITPTPTPNTPTPTPTVSAFNGYVAADVEAEVGLVSTATDPLIWASPFDTTQATAFEWGGLVGSVPTSVLHAGVTGNSVYTMPVIGELGYHAHTATIVVKWDNAPAALDPTQLFGTDTPPDYTGSTIFNVSQRRRSRTYKGTNLGAYASTKNNADLASMGNLVYEPPAIPLGVGTLTLTIEIYGVHLIPPENDVVDPLDPNGWAASFVAMYIPSFLPLEDYL